MLQPLGSPLPPDPELHRVPLHGGPLTAACVLRDGTTAIAGTAEGKLIRWSMATGEVLERQQAHQGAVTHLVARGRTVVSCSTDRTARVWTAERELRLRRVHDEHLHAVRQAAVTDTHLVTVGDDAVVRVYGLAEGAIQLALPGHRHPVRVVAIHDNLAVTGSIDHELRVWDLRTGEALPSLGEPGPMHGQTHGSVLHALGAGPVAIAFPYPHRVLVAMGSTVTAWDLSTRSSHTVISGLAWPIEALAAQGDRVVVATATEIRGVHSERGDRVWLRQAVPPGGVGALALARDHLVIAGRDGAIRALDPARWSPAERHVAPALGALVGPDGTVAVTADHDHSVRLWSVTTGTPRSLLDSVPEPGAPAVAFSGDGQLVATGQRHQSPAVLVHHHDGRPAHALDHLHDGRPVAVQSLCFAWDGVLVGPRDEAPIQWWGLDGSTVRTLQGRTGHVERMVLVGHQLVSEARFSPRPGDAPVPHLQVWDLWRQCLAWSVPAEHDGGFGPLARYGEHGVLAGTGRSATELGCWDLGRGQLRRQVDLQHPLAAVAVAPDGAVYAVVVSPEARVQELVRLDATLTVLVRRPLPPEASHVALAASGDRIAWAEGREVVVAELLTGVEVGRSELHEPAVSSLALTPDGRHVVVGGASGGVHVLRAS